MVVTKYFRWIFVGTRTDQKSKTKDEVASNPACKLFGDQNNILKDKLPIKTYFWTSFIRSNLLIWKHKDSKYKISNSECHLGKLFSLLINNYLIKLLVCVFHYQTITFIFAVKSKYLFFLSLRLKYLELCNNNLFNVRHVPLRFRFSKSNVEFYINFTETFSNWTTVELSSLQSAGKTHSLITLRCSLGISSECTVVSYKGIYMSTFQIKQTDYYNRCKRSSYLIEHFIDKY